MTAEIEKGKDNIVLHKTGAWHHYGIVVGKEFTPRQGLTIGGIEWGVESRLVASFNPNTQQWEEIPSRRATHRADNNDFMGVVSNDYFPIQNIDLADFCAALVDQGTVYCETVGSIRGGKRVWFLLKGENFNVAMEDEIAPYILVSNGHDGGASLRITPTTIRVVCSNTLHAVIPYSESAELGKAAFKMNHTPNIMQRVEDAKLALARYGKAIEDTRNVANVLSKKDVKQEDVQKFFLENYTRDFGEIPGNPTNKKEQNRYDKAQSALGSFSKRFDDERAIAGASLWNAFNAYSGLVQHDQKTRGKDDAKRIERRIYSNLFGLDQRRTQAALAVAYGMMG